MATSIINRKFLRNYELRIQKTSSSDYIVIKPPFTLEVQIQRNVLSSVNNCSFRIYNLSETSRNEIQKDSTEFYVLKKMELKAGYGENLYTIFSGNVISGYSERVGSDFITSVDGFDGGFAMRQAIANKTFKAGTGYKDIVEYLADTMGPYDVKKGSIGQITGATTRSIAMSGSSYDKLIELTGGRVFIDNKKLNVLSVDEYAGSYVPEISSSTGLLGTPRVESTRLTFRMIFEPRLIIGQQIIMKSTTQKKLLNGNKYKIVSLSHSGIFSEAVSGTMTTEVGCFFAPKGFRAVT